MAGWGELGLGSHPIKFLLELPPMGSRSYMVMCRCRRRRRYITAYIIKTGFRTLPIRY